LFDAPHDRAGYHRRPVQVRLMLALSQLGPISRFRSL
jgi:hypothetical protein